MKHVQLFLSFLLFSTFSFSSFEESFNQGIAFIHQDKKELAIAAFNHAAQLHPTHAPTFFNIGLIYISLAQYEYAKKYLEEAIHYDQRYTKAYSHLALVYGELKLFEQAINCYHRLIDIGTENADIHRSLGRLYGIIKNSPKAAHHLLQALAYDDKDLLTLFELGFFYTLEQRYDDAAYYYKKLIELYPHRTDVMYNLAYALRSAGNFTLARDYYEKYLTQYASAPHALYGYAECCLALGQFEQGWPAFEARWKRDADVRHFGKKLWDGSSLHNKTIVVRAEYGQGDTIQFIRYAQLLKKQGATVIVEAQDTLLTLLAGCSYIDRVIPVDQTGNNLPDHDYQVPLMSLPLYYQTKVDTIPCTIPYITVPEVLTKQWEKTINTESAGCLKIGVCWEGSPYYEQFKSVYSKKSIPLIDFEPIAALTGVRLYSLQKMNGTEQLKTVPSSMQIYDFGSSFDQDNGRFMDSAAVIKNLDLIITTDTSIAHLAGALGKPVWVILPMVADWRWMIERSDSPWYPSMRLFRQTQTGQWNDVMQSVAREVQNLIPEIQKSPNHQAASILAEIQIGELIDKVTILQIKKERIKDPCKLRNIENELNTLLETYRQNIKDSPLLQQLWKTLKKINEKLWCIEDDIRDKERASSFDEEFIRLARAVYYTNDERCRIKKDINTLTGSRLIEEKSYSAY